MPAYPLDVIGSAATYMPAAIERFMAGSRVWDAIRSGLLEHQIFLLAFFGPGGISATKSHFFHFLTVFCVIP
jgi:hypothetical protein